MLPSSDEVDAIRAREKDWNLEGGKVSQELDVMVKSYLKRKLCLLFFHHITIRFSSPSFSQKERLSKEAENHPLTMRQFAVIPRC